MFRESRLKKKTGKKAKKPPEKAKNGAGSMFERIGAPTRGRPHPERKRLP